MMPSAFVPQSSKRLIEPHSQKRLSHRHFCPYSRSVPKMVIEPASIGTGYAFFNSLKDVVIGPSINEITAAIAGGTVGVMGTIIALEVRRQQVKERKQCPYCRGTGKIPCGSCYTIGAIPSGDAVTAQEACHSCSSRGFLQCNHVRYHISSFSILSY